MTDQPEPEFGHEPVDQQPPRDLGLHANFDFQPQSQNVVIAIAPQGARSVLNAEEIAALKAADPAALELLYRMTERQQIHDHKMDEDTLRSESRYRIAGIAGAVFVVASLVAVAGMAILTGHPVEGAAIGTAAGLSAVAGVFVRGRALSSRQPEASPPAMAQHSAPMQRIPTSAPLPSRD